MRRKQATITTIRPSLGQGCESEGDGTGAEAGVEKNPVGSLGLHTAEWHREPVSL